MANKEIALTTIDNPYSPFSQWDQWYAFDLENGTDCCGYIARMNEANTTLLEEDVESQLIEQTIDEIVNLDPTGMYIKVEKVDPKSNENGKDFKAVSTSSNSSDEKAKNQ